MDIKLSWPWWQFLKPKHWLYLPLFLLLALLAQLPYRCLYALAKALAPWLMKIDRKGCHTAKVNIKLAFPELNAIEQQQFLIDNYLSITLSVLETAMAWFGSAKRLQHLLTIEGVAHLQAAKQSGRGVILASAHLGCLEITGRLLSERHAIGVMYRQQKWSLLNAFAKYYRKRCYQQIIARQDLRTLIRTLKAGQIIWYTPDIDAGLKNSVFAPFFGIPTATLTTTSRLAAKTQAIVIPTFFYRKADPKGFRLVFQAPLAHFPSGDDYQDACHLNHVIEQAILKAPTQYLWQYKRFKTRPVGEKRFY